MIEEVNPEPALAYVNFSRWVADCPKGCGNAYLVSPDQMHFLCETPYGCGHIGPLKWPVDAQAIWNTLMTRPMPKTRNWFPKDHPLALKAGCPSGQTVEDLVAEGRVNGVQ